MYVTLWKQGKQKEISNIDPHGQTYKMIEWVAASVNSKSSSLAVHKSIKYWLSVRTTQGVPDINLVKLRNPFLCIAKPLQIKEFMPKMSIAFWKLQIPRSKGEIWGKETFEKTSLL